MRVSMRMVALIVCITAASVFAAAKVSKDAKMTVKDANTTTQGTKDVKQPVVAPPVSIKAVEPANATAEVSAEPNSNETAATVNGKTITEGDIEAQIKKARMDRMLSQVPPNMVEQYKKRLRSQVLEMIIVEQLLGEQVAKAGITVSDSDANAKISEIAAQQGMSLDAFKNLLQSQGQDFAQIQQTIKKQLTYEKLLEKQLGKMDVNDADALAHYEQNKADFNTSEQVQASHILIKVAPSATPEEKAQAKEKAAKLLKQVKGGGDFAEIARENSDCPSKAKGGDLGLFERGMMVKEFENAAFAMQPGQISDIVETQFGYHIIKVTDRKPGGLTPFEKAKPDIIKTLERKKENLAAKEYIDKLKAEAKIVYPAGKEPVQERMVRPVPSPGAADTAQRPGK